MLKHAIASIVLQEASKKLRSTNPAIKCYFAELKRKVYFSNSYLIHLPVVSWWLQKRVYYELFAGALGMGLDCEMSLHRYYTYTPAEPLGVHELVARGV